VRGRLAFELRLTWLGGLRVLERIEALHYDTLRQRPQLTASDRLSLLGKALVSRS
jgi:phytoene synthase